MEFGSYLLRNYIFHLEGFSTILDMFISMGETPYSMDEKAVFFGMTEMSHRSGFLANILQRNTNPAPGIKENDVQWILGLQYSF